MSLNITVPLSKLKEVRDRLPNLLEKESHEHTNEMQELWSSDICPHSDSRRIL
jgi:flagellar motor switch protein FliM